jgi:phosphoglycolate phosphatase
MIELLKVLISAPHVRVGIVSRNVTQDPATTLAIVLARHGVDPQSLDFLRCIGRGSPKLGEFRELRQRYGINPLRSIVCGDEASDYFEARAAGMSALIASYGFEEHSRLLERYDIPAEIIAGSPELLAAHLCHTLELPLPEQSQGFISA